MRSPVLDAFSPIPTPIPASAFWSVPAPTLGNFPPADPCAGSALQEAICQLAHECLYRSSMVATQVTLTARFDQHHQLMTIRKC